MRVNHQVPRDMCSQISAVASELNVVSIRTCLKLKWSQINVASSQSGLKIKWIVPDKLVLQWLSWNHSSLYFCISKYFSGFQTLIVALYNLSWNLLSSSTEIDEIQLKYRGSAVATVAGSLYLLGFSSSLYHLVLLSQQRLHAIAFPINYKLQSSSTTHALICIVWTASIASAALPSKSAAGLVDVVFPPK